MHDDDGEDGEVHRNFNVAEDCFDWGGFDSVFVWLSSKVQFVVSEDSKCVGHYMLKQECIHHVISDSINTDSLEDFISFILL